MSARTLAQRARRECEAAAKVAGTSTNRPPRPAPRPVEADGPGQLSVGQQACRQNECNARAVVHLPTPPRTQIPQQQVPIACQPAGILLPAVM